MKANATKSIPLGGVFWDGGVKTFINKGSNGRWRDALFQEEVKKYERIANENLDSNCAQWPAIGKVA